MLRIALLSTLVLLSTRPGLTIEWPRVSYDRRANNSIDENSKELQSDAIPDNSANHYPAIQADNEGNQDFILFDKFQVLLDKISTTGAEKKQSKEENSSEKEKPAKEISTEEEQKVPEKSSPEKKPEEEASAKNGKNSEEISPTAPPPYPAPIKRGDDFFFDFKYTLDTRFILYVSQTEPWCTKYCKYLCRASMDKVGLGTGEPYYNFTEYPVLCFATCNSACTGYYTDEWATYSEKDRDIFYTEYAAGRVPGGTVPGGNLP